MKKIIISICLHTFALTACPQWKGDEISSLSQSDITVVERNDDGSIRSVRYAITDNNIPKTADEFFNETLKKRESDKFVLDRYKNTDYGMSFERYQQYYQGVKVENGYYNFRFKNGKMKGVKGHYVNVSEINPVPLITKEQALNLYASYFGIERCDVINTYVDLLIMDIPDAEREKYETFLVYKVFLFTGNNKNGYVGIFDAHTGKLLFKEDAFVDYSATGQFYTYYNRGANDSPKSAITDCSNNNYHLIDYNRGSGILTGTYIGQPDYFSDNDNIWTRNEMGSYNIALDVHWTMEKIYDFMSSSFNWNSYDGNNHQISSIIDSSGNAQYFFYTGWFFFGNSSGSTINGPLGSVDIVGHEFGHAILFNSTNITQGGAIHEGLADIWGIIFEKRITPSANCWKTGEQTMINGYSCMRNFQNPNDATAYTQIAHTYDYGAFYSSDSHIVGGILPYWFYLLVNGGSGTNGYNNNYQLVPIGFNLAEQLFVNTTLTTAYLEGCTTFQGVMYAFIDAAEDMGDAFLAEQVRNAWYAVGLNSEPPHIYLQSYAPGSATYYVYGNANCSVNWSFTKTLGTMPTLVPNNSNYSCTVYTSSSFGGYLYATIYSGGSTVTYSKYITGAANPSSVGDYNMQLIPLDETHYQISLDRYRENAFIKIYDSKNLQIKANEKMMENKYMIDTSSWSRGLYIVKLTIGNKSYTTKLSRK